MTNICVLVVEDELINRELLIENLTDNGYITVAAESGEEAWRLIEADPARFDVILLDRVMPDIDGIEVLKRVRAHGAMRHTPVIMQTSRSSAEEVAEGLRAGAYYYLTKPFSADTLLAIVAAAGKDRRQQLVLEEDARQITHNLACLQKAEFRFRSPDEARSLATMMARATPDPNRVILGLSELMLNAIEHGNLGITYAEKSELIREEQLQSEVARRLETAAYADRYAVLEYERGRDETHFLIRDQGAGFAWQEYLEITPERAFDTHGRGIAMARMISFDAMEYRGKGNEVRVTLKHPAHG